MIALLGLVVMVGAVVQSSVGFGLAVVAAPVVVLAAPALMPGSILVCGFVLPLYQLLRGPRDVATGVLTRAMLARLALTPVGVWIVAIASPTTIGLVIGVAVLLVVGVSLTRLRVEATGTNALAAGAISGVSGTAAAIGGPFLALVLQHEPPTRIRSTLAAFFVLGSAVSMTGLALGGQLTSAQLLVGAAWVPFLLLGHLLGGPVARVLSPARMRAAVLAVCTVAAVVVIVRALLG